MQDKYMQNKKELVTLNNVIINVDLSELVKKENLYFNATEIAKQFGKRVQHYLDTQQTQDLVAVITEAEKTASEKLIKITRGGKYQGTWLHNSLAIDFARWCSAEFAYHLDKWVTSKLNEEKQRKQSRALARLEYPQMTHAIQEAHSEPKPYHFSNEADLINRIVLGTTTKRYCELNNLDRVCLRVSLSNQQIELINNLQRLNTSMIELSMGFEERKERLEIRYAQLVAKLIS